MTRTTSKHPREEFMFSPVGTVVKAGPFMEALSPAEIEWEVVTPYDDKTETCLAKARWLGVNLGLFSVGREAIVDVTSK